MNHHRSITPAVGSISLAGALLLGSVFSAAQPAHAQAGAAPPAVSQQGNSTSGAQGYRTTPPPSPALIKAANPPKDVVDIELLTWAELYKEIHEEGKTTAIVFNGDTEQRGPQDVIGGHTIIAHGTAELIAKKLGNALVAPVLPFALGGADPNHPGGLGVSADTFTAVNQEVTEQLIRNGFKNIVLIGDHGGGQKQLHDLALKLDAQYSPQGVRVIYSDGSRITSSTRGWQRMDIRQVRTEGFPTPRSSCILKAARISMSARNYCRRRWEIRCVRALAVRAVVRDPRLPVRLRFREVPLRQRMPLALQGGRPTQRFPASTMELPATRAAPPSSLASASSISKSTTVWPRSNNCSASRSRLLAPARP